MIGNGIGVRKMRRKQRKLYIWDIQDDKKWVERHKTTLRDEFTRLHITQFNNMAEALRSDKEVDCIFVDIGAIAGGGSLGGLVNMVYLHNTGMYRQAFERLVKDRPGVFIVLYSAMGQWAEDISDELKEMMPDALIYNIDLRFEKTLFLREQFSSYISKKYRRPSHDKTRAGRRSKNAKRGDKSVIYGCKDKC